MVAVRPGMAPMNSPKKPASRMTPRVVGVKRMFAKASPISPRSPWQWNLEELVDDPRFRDTYARGENRVELIRLLDDKFAQKTYDEWAKVMRESGDFIFSTVQRLSELKDDPQVVANGYIADVDHPTLGPIKLADHPIRYSETPHSIRSVAPELGQHTEEILLKLGYDWPDITDLQDKGVIL